MKKVVVIGMGTPPPEIIKELNSLFGEDIEIITASKSSEKMSLTDFVQNAIRSGNRKRSFAEAVDDGIEDELRDIVEQVFGKPQTREEAVKEFLDACGCPACKEYIEFANKVKSTESESSKLALLKERAKYMANACYGGYEVFKAELAKHGQRPFENVVHSKGRALAVVNGILLPVSQTGTVGFENDVDTWDKFHWDNTIQNICESIAYLPKHPEDWIKFHDLYQHYENKY